MLYCCPQNMSTASAWYITAAVAAGTHRGTCRARLLGILERIARLRLHQLLVHLEALALIDLVQCDHRPVLAHELLVVLLQVLLHNALLRQLLNLLLRDLARLDELRDFALVARARKGLEGALRHLPNGRNLR